MANVVDFYIIRSVCLPSQNRQIKCTLGMGNKLLQIGLTDPTDWVKVS